MSFTSLPFWLLAVLTFSVTIFFSSGRIYRGILLAASLIFYSSGEGAILSILLVSSGIDFAAGFFVGPENDSKKRKVALVLSLAGNLGFLFFFKYLHFVTADVLPLLGIKGLEQPLRLLPLGISFYTFQSMSYTIDVYRGKLKPCRAYWDFLLFVTFFPQLIAGPIERATHLLPQILKAKRAGLDEIRLALIFIASGFFKKMFIANSIGTTAQLILTDSNARPLEWYLGGWTLAMQVYFDFSAYSDFALGLGLIFGIRLSENFRPVWFATNPLAFWERWNITTGRWFRDYFLIPIGGNGSSRFSAARNMIFMFTAVGLWHGASWNWLVWGAMHGVVVAVYRDLKKNRPALIQATPMAIGFFFIQFILLPASGFLHFASDERFLENAARCFKNSFWDLSGVKIYLPHIMGYVLPGVGWDILREKFDFRNDVSPVSQVTLVALLLGFAFFLCKGINSPGFVYFDF